MARLSFGDRGIVIAMDHARTLGVVPGLEDPGLVLDRVIAAGADAIMTSYGVIKHYRDKLLGRLPVYLRLDGGPSITREDWLRYTEWSLLHTVEDARRLGVDGVCVMGFMGGDVEMRTYDIVARVVGDCAADGLPVMVEALPCPAERIPNPLDAGAMASASRIAFELGADIVKTYYTGSADSFRRVTSTCPAPVLIAGGVKMETVRDALAVVHGSVQAGGRGVVFGRNIWQAPDPAAVVRALAAIIHRGHGVDEAMAAGGLPG
ncbi:fructose-bisphosphate aldolase [Mycobacterium sp. KBS0706]|uniref:class I fructose-bisphosphate aldolase n=1 Tax=Mycobacterium sp. KBS0706 TaxID=2578109 RepID=UPI00110FB07B|nr:fructose-bisphosphate aldolase [Mycobacterium sp. KBS0706]TSD88785.1 fructose-bisphosphate aldolase [Mycobacterium sp. KBS0706]